MTCPYFGICGGCTMQDVPMAEQLASKEADLLGLLDQQGVQPARVLLPLDGPAWGYRHRARLAAKYVLKKGGALVGFRECAGRYITVMDACPILADAISRLIAPLRRLIDDLSVRDAVPQIEAAKGDATVALTLRHLRELDENDVRLLTAFEDEHNCRIYLQPAGPASIVPLTPCADGVLAYRLDDWDLSISFGPIDFIQVNPAINRQLIRRAIDLLNVQQDDAVVDLFCGLGNFSLPLARQGARVVGIELVDMQVERARSNAASNGLSERTHFETRDLYERECASLAGYDKAILDPPRSGAEQVVRSWHSASPNVIVYVSCNPQTLARDAALLVRQKGFALNACGIVNMFPHTAHAEAIALFMR